MNSDPWLLTSVADQLLLTGTKVSMQQMHGEFKISTSVHFSHLVFHRNIGKKNLKFCRVSTAAQAK